MILPLNVEILTHGNFHVAHIRFLVTYYLCDTWVWHLPMLGWCIVIHGVNSDMAYHLSGWKLQAYACSTIPQDLFNFHNHPISYPIPYLFPIQFFFHLNILQYQSKYSFYTPKEFPIQALFNLSFNCWVSLKKCLC